MKSATLKNISCVNLHLYNQT